MANLCTMWRVDTVRTTAYHPAGNGACERLNQTLKLGLQKVIDGGDPELWDIAIHEVMFSYNTTVHSATGYTPQFLMFGEEARMPSEVIVGLPASELTPFAYAFQRYRNLSIAYEAAP